MDDDEPRFGEVWKWQDIGPVMALGLTELEHGIGFECIMLDPRDQGRPARVLSLMWDQPGASFRKDWHRIDEGENS